LHNKHRGSLISIELNYRGRRDFNDSKLLTKNKALKAFKKEEILSCKQAAKNKALKANGKEKILSCKID